MTMSPVSRRLIINQNIQKKKKRKKYKFDLIKGRKSKDWGVTIMVTIDPEKDMNVCTNSTAISIYVNSFNLVDFRIFHWISDGGFSFTSFNFGKILSEIADITWDLTMRVWCTIVRQHSLFAVIVYQYFYLWRVDVSMFPLATPQIIIDNETRQNMLEKLTKKTFRGKRIQNLNAFSPFKINLIIF